VLVKITRRNQINLCLIVLLSALVISSFRLTPTLSIGLFFVLAVVPKLFWLSFDYVTCTDPTGVVASFRSAHPAPSEDAETTIELAS
jgi:hypothetical protein